VSEPRMLVQHRNAWQATFEPRKVAISAALVVLAALVPYVFSGEYTIGVLITMLIIVTLNASWNFLLGFAGVWNFGQLAMYAVGGYGAGLLIIHTGMSPWLGLLAGGVIGTALATIIAFPTLRLYGIYTSLLTFAAAEVVRLLIEGDGSGFTGGSFGLPSVQGLFTTLSPEGQGRAWYWLTLAVAVVTVTGYAVIVKSTFGLGLRMMRDSLPYGSGRGISALRSRVFAFMISGFSAGVAGALYTVYNGSISPDAMGLTPMSIYVTMIVVGGLGTISGPIIGTVLLTGVQQALIDHPGTQLTVFGAILLVIVVFLPRGVVAGAKQVRSRVRQWIEEDNEDEAVDEPADDAGDEGDAVAAPEHAISIRPSGG
jgi:branched-chain amino acid transport system permease protein